MILLDFRYRAHFPFAEMQLTKLGMIFEEKVELLGVDPPGGTTGQRILLHGTPFGPIETQILDVPSGDDMFPKPAAIQLIRQFIITVSRAQLDEDPSHPLVGPDWDADELRCRVRIESRLPPAVGFSNEEVLGGQIVVEELENVQVINTEVITAEATSPLAS
jgi:hypothetical protein